VKQQNENLNFMNMYLCCVVVATIQILKWHESQACESIVNRLCKLLLALWHFQLSSFIVEEFPNYCPGQKLCLSV